MPKITQKPIRDLGFPDEAKIGGIIRGENGYVANGDTQIQEGIKWWYLPCHRELRNWKNSLNNCAGSLGEML